MGFFFAQLLTGLSNAAGLFLVASGLSLIFGVTRIVNFAHGSFYMLGAYFGVTLMGILPDYLGSHVGFWGSIVLTGVIVGLVGALVEIVVLRPIYRAPELFQLVATFGVILMIQDLALMSWGAEDIMGARAPGLRGVFRIFGEPIPKYDIVLICITPFILIALWWLIAKTRLGILVRAATQDREMVGALGVNQRWLFTGVFALGSALAGWGGALQLPKGGADLLMDMNIIGPLFVVVVIGGMGSLPGAFIASVIISVLNVFGVTYMPQSTLVLMFVVMAIVLIFRPYGLLGKEEVAGEHGQVGAPEAPIRPFGRTGRLAVTGLLAVLALLPLVSDPFLLVLMTDIIIFALFAASLHFILGAGGLTSFGHAAFYGGGAYVAALLVTYAKAPMEIAFIAAPIGAGMLALVVGWFCIRLSGVYLAMLTLAFSQLVWSLAFQWRSVTRGDDGLINIWPSEWLSGQVPYYYFTLVIGAAGILFLRHVIHAPFGYALRAARDSARQAEATGIDVKRVQYLAFALAGALAGLAGGLFVFAKGSVFPTELEIGKSFDALIVVFLGGIKTLSGGVVGAAFMATVEDWLTRMEYWRLMLGMLIIAVVILAPEGIVGSARRLGERLGLIKRAEAEE